MMPGLLLMLLLLLLGRKNRYSRLLVLLFLDGLLREVAVLVLVLRDPPALLYVLAGPDEACKPAECSTTHQLSDGQINGIEGRGREVDVWREEIDGGMKGRGGRGGERGGG